MERTKLPERLTIPDAINCSYSVNFTPIPNDILRNPNMSAKAKAVICLLLSNRDGWQSHMTILLTMMKESKDAIRSAITELERHQYLLRIRYRDKITKAWMGTLWAYTDTPGAYNLEQSVQLLSQRGLELENSNTENPSTENPPMVNPPLIIPIYNNTNNIHPSSTLVPKLFDLFWEVYPKKVDKGKALTAWSKLCSKPPSQRPTWHAIKKAIILQKKSERWQTPKYIPHPTTWLNQRRWLDDPKQMKIYNYDTCPPIYDDGIKYVWDAQKERYVHSKTGEIYIP